MSQIIPQNQLENGEVFGMLIDDGSVFNLQILQAGLGLSEASTKAWCARHRVRPVVQGRTWIFTGRTFRTYLESHHEKDVSNEAGESVRQESTVQKVPATRLDRSRQRA